MIQKEFNSYLLTISVILIGSGIFYFIRMSSIIIFEKHDCVGVNEINLNLLDKTC